MQRWGTLRAPPSAAADRAGAAIYPGSRPPHTPAEGKAKGKGLPDSPRLAAIARTHFDMVRLPFPPPGPGAPLAA